VSARAASPIEEEEAVRCTLHEPGQCPGEEGGCVVLRQGRLLEDRLLAIEGLLTEVRACLLDNCVEVMSGVSVTAALEAARLLARSITREADADPEVGHRGGAARVRWAVLRPEREEPSPPTALALRRRKR
jgi:hypothetical protein